MRDKLFVLILALIAISTTLAAPAFAQSQSAPPAQTVSAPKRIVESGKDVALKRIDHVTPVYPLHARQYEIQGKVVIHAVISTKGEVIETKVVSSPDSSLTRAALDCVKKFRYTPATFNGDPVEVDTTISIEFSIHP